MTGKNNGFVKTFFDSNQAQDVLVSHCIIHQENLCSKVLGFSEVVRNITCCAVYIQARGFNHRQ